MKAQEVMNLRGRLTIWQWDSRGRLVAENKINNSIVQSGRDLVAKLFINETINPVSHFAVGTGSTPVNPASDTALNAELFRKAINPVDPTKDLVVVEGPNVRVTMTGELDFNEGNGALTEAGLLNADTGGVLYNRVVFPPINKTTDFKLTLVWEVIF